MRLLKIREELKSENSILKNELDVLMIAYAELERKYKNVKSELEFYKKGEDQIEHL